MVNEKANNIREMLNNGEVVMLVCVNKEGFAPVPNSYNDEVLRSGKLEVSSVTESGGVILKNGLTIMKTELRFFKIKECVTTFNELIDVAVQAWKDGVLSRVAVSDLAPQSLRYRLVGDTEDSIIFNQHEDYSEIVAALQSLYTETFVIEYDSDMEAIFDGAKITLANGNVGTFNFVNGLRSITNIEDGFEIMGLNTFWLKGATVTQKRRINE